MSGYYNSNDPMRRDSPYDLNAGRDGGAWAWIAGAALVVILVALAFGVHHGKQGGVNVAQNNPWRSAGLLPHLLVRRAQHLRRHQ